MDYIKSMMNSERYQDMLIDFNQFINGPQEMLTNTFLQQSGRQPPEAQQAPQQRPQ